jgi:uncharacterized membrane protein (DUF441 family)
MDGIWILAIIALLGIVSKNSTVWIASIVLLGLSLLSYKFSSSQWMLQWFEQKGIRWGVIVLTIGVLSSIALGKMGWVDIWNTSKSYVGWLSIGVGIFVAYLGGKGVNILITKPDIMTGLLIGTIIGVALFRGVPVGPLIAAGILAVFTQWAK